MFSPPKPKASPAPAPAPPPAADDPAIEEARRKERMAAAKRKGRAATILTSGLGDTTGDTSAQTTKLGGGA
ncbi:hypothetical protein HBA54_27180 [Pelagibius litoralis]|uniref:Uncharacterized protein n=1 Tax=Pelagibius litoralis TaxID=374515 RepID=A0A967F316_9PROT|nr:hypothetical protein [Pelagibius litoralis]